MPIQSYVDFKKDFEVTRKEYFAIRDEIIYKWDSFINDYKNRLKLMLNEVNAIEKDRFYKQMISNIPTKEEYKESFKMLISAKTIPQVDKNSGLHDEINNIIAKDLVGVIFETIAGCLQKSFKIANSAVKSYRDTLNISSKTLGAINKIPTVLKTRNVAANNNSMISEIIDLFQEASEIDDMDEKASICEIILAKSYIYALDNELPIKGSPAIKESDLRNIYEIS
jgi:hypothetical protein